MTLSVPLILACRLLATTTDEIVIYVAPDGDDSWSGRIAAADGSDGPFASLQRAQKAARDAKSRSPFAPVSILLREGVYALDEPFTLSPEDSGCAYAAYPGETPILSAGARIDEWDTVELDGKTVWRADVGAGTSFRQLFVNGERRPRARRPNAGWFQVEELPDMTDETRWNDGQTRFRFAQGDIEAWDDADEAEVIALHFWTDSHLPIAKIDATERIVEFSKRSVFRLTADHSKSGAYYSVENTLAALDLPGEWVLHAKTGTLYYLPMADEEISAVEAIAPKLTQAIRVDGEPESGRFVEDVTLRGLSIRHTEWYFGPEYEPQWPREDIGGMVQAAFAVPGAIRLNGARRCVVEDCEIAQVGTYGVELARGCQDNVVRRNRIEDLGAGGVKVGETVIREPAGEQTHRNEVTDNLIASGGRLFHSAVGVWIGQSGGNVIAHNEIRDFYYTGISVGWSWGYGRSLSSHNRIAHNHIHTIGQGWLSDMGGIYTLGVSPGMVIRNNLIHDVRSRRYGGWGIYPDEGTSHAVIENNIVYRLNRCGFHLHYGKDNLIQNNIFALAGEDQICRARPDPFVFRRNIVYWKEGDLLGGNWNELNVEMNRNVYYRVGGDPIAPAGRSWSEWRSEGMDTESVVADPLFVDAEKDDFRLRPDSPAFALGFQPIDMSDVGPRPK